MQERLEHFAGQSAIARDVHISSKSTLRPWNATHGQFRDATATGGRYLTKIYPYNSKKKENQTENDNL